MQHSEKSLNDQLDLTEDIQKFDVIVETNNVKLYLNYCDLAEVRVAVAAFVQQHLPLPLQESQGLVPGGLRP